MAHSSTPVAEPSDATKAAKDPKSQGAKPKLLGPRIVTGIFVLVPLFALIVALPLLLQGVLPLTWVDIALGFVFYSFATIGITVGFHRYFTHGSFKSKPWVRYTLGIAGCSALEGTVTSWVANHRKHHAFTDKAGDPHSPWMHGESTTGVAKGLYHAHVGWLFKGEAADETRYAPDLLKDPITRRVDTLFPYIVAASLLLPALLGGLITWSWIGALSALVWASLVRVALLHHVTWSINSICHVWGKRPFKTRDKSGNVAWLAIPSSGEAWHNYHHADQTSARLGVLARQFDAGAVTIRLLEMTGQAHDVRWPSEKRVESKLTAEAKEENPRVHPSLIRADARRLDLREVPHKSEV